MYCLTVPILVCRWDQKRNTILEIPLLFPEPETKDAWITRSVLGEQLCLEDGHRVFEASLPGALNGLNAFAYLYGLYGAYKRNSQATAIGGRLALTCKIVYLHVLVTYYDQNAPRSEAAEPDD